MAQGLSVESLGQVPNREDQLWLCKADWGGFVDWLAVYRLAVEASFTLVVDLTVVDFLLGSPVQLAEIS